jgi:hypothetical protein
MSVATSRLNILRFVTPAQLVMCVILFFLPWTEIQCPMPAGGLNFDFNAPRKAGPPEIAWTGFVQQSGFQVATGTYSFVDTTLQRMFEAEKGAKKDDIPGAPLLWGYLIAVFVGVGLGFAMAPGKVRKCALVACCILALGSAGGQAAMGFPLKTKLDEEIKKDRGVAGVLGPQRGNAKGNFGDDLEPRSALKIPFFLALLFALGALVTAVLEPTTPTTSGSKPRGKYDFDDENDEAPMALEDEPEPGEGKERDKG